MVQLIDYKMAKAFRLTFTLASAFLFSTANSFSPTVLTFSGHTRLFSSQSPTSESEEPTHVEPEVLQPFLPATDPMYAVRGSIGEDDFIVTRDGGPTKEELSNENVLKIVNLQCNDLEVNTLVWKCLGYRFDADDEEWKPDEVFPNWRERYPNPPDLVGMSRIFSQEVDTPVLRANQAITKSVPVEFKNSLRTHLKPLGFRGFKLDGLTPNMTRRAQCTNWLIFYREQLFGFTVEELKERKEKRKREAEKREAEERAQGKEPK